MKFGGNNQQNGNLNVGGASIAESRNFMNMNPHTKLSRNVKFLNIHSIVGASNAKNLSNSHNLTHGSLLVNDHLARMISTTKEEINDDEISLSSSSSGNHNN